MAIILSQHLQANWLPYARCVDAPSNSLNICGASATTYLVGKSRMHILVPDRNEITQDTPLRLSVAAALAYPDGTMTAAGLRREARRGRLVIERVAGKDYTTLANIEGMRKLCRLDPKVPVFGCGQHDEMPAVGPRTPPLGLSATENISKARDAALMIVKELSERSPPISPVNTSPKRP